MWDRDRKASIPMKLGRSILAAHIAACYFAMAVLMGFALLRDRNLTPSTDMICFIVATPLLIPFWLFAAMQKGVANVGLTGSAILSFAVLYGMGLAATWLMMFRRERLAERRRRGLCTACGYSLTGNTSGVCPECGTAVKAKAGMTGIH